MSKILKAAHELFEEFNKNDILYCHWKSNEHLYEGLIGETDLDVIVHPDCKEKAKEKLFETGYIQLSSQYGSNYPDVEDWITCDEETGKLIHIHLHFRMATGHKGLKEYSLPWTNVILENRIFNSDYEVYVCPPDYEIVALFTRIGLKASYLKYFKAIIGKYKFNNSDLREIAYLKDLVDYSKVESILSEFYGNDYKELLKIIQNEKLNSSDMAKLVHLANIYMSSYSSTRGVKAFIKRTWYSFSLPVRTILRKRLDISIITKKTLGENKGITIAFMGQDGAGKTTVTEEIKKWLSWKLDARKYYLGNGDNYWSWRKKLSVALKPIKFAPVKVLRGILIINDLKQLSKHTYKLIQSASHYAQKGGIVIYDRYPQVEYYGINDGPKIRKNYLPKIRSSIIARYVEKCAEIEEKYIKMSSEICPDGVIKLILDPEISIQRKPQESLENVQKKHEIIKKLDFPGSNTILIDANQDYEKELISIHCFVWEQIVHQQARTYHRK